VETIVSTRGKKFKKNKKNKMKKERPQNKNLKPPINKRTTREQREIKSKGGKKSGEVRKEKKNFQQAMRWALEMKDDEGLTNLELMVKKQVEKAKKGDNFSFVPCRDTVGEKPVDKIDNLNPTTVINNNTLSIDKLKELKNKLEV
jgi:hypothetical protein